MQQASVSQSRRGRKSKLTPDTIEILVADFHDGASTSDACARAGLSESTFHLWMSIGEKLLGGGSHPKAPRNRANYPQYIEFFVRIKKAQAQGNLARISQINRAAQDMWTHQQTGAVRYTAPPPITWFNPDTGELVHDDPKRAGKPGEWQKQFSGEVWRHQRGEWQAAAWYLERSDPGNWGKRTFITLEHNIRIETVNRVILALVQAGLDPAEVFEDMIVEAEYETPELRPENPRPD